MMPHVGIQMSPEEADLGPDPITVDAGSHIELIRFDAGMTSGRTSIGICIPLKGAEDPRVELPDGNVWILAQTSLRALKAAVDALEARDEAEGRPG